MGKIIVDEKKIDELLERGVEKVYPDKETLKKKLLSGERIKLYCGYDPSASSLHIGNAISINKLGQFQDLGHEVIFLIGEFTGMIGDPTDKGAVRKKMTRDEVKNNSKSYKKQASAFLKFSGKNKAKVLRNSKWNDKLSFKDLIELSSHFTVQQMIQRDMFQKRLEENRPIYLHEFLYPLAQGYDSVAMNVDLEIGGNDQMFNMLCGRDLQKAINHKEKFVLTMKLLADDHGNKMGKSEGNAVFLNESNTEMFGKVMSWADGLIINAMELCTRVDMSEILEMKGKMERNEINPKDLKMRLAYEIVKIYYGENLAKKAQEHFINTFQKKEIPADLPEVYLSPGKMNIVDLLLAVKLVSSKGEARRLIEQGGIKVDEQAVGDVGLEVELKDALIIQRGKRLFVKTKIK
ncbi:MAG: tyrosine--tRNA ligase [Patescibacteria group bacterium]|nr:tyrosine--tRNA ligase [Patescibacteria group bacterium]